MEISQNDELEAMNYWTEAETKGNIRIFRGKGAEDSRFDAVVPDLVSYRSRKEIRKGTKRRQVTNYHQDWPPPPLGLP